MEQTAKPFIEKSTSNSTEPSLKSTKSISLSLYQVIIEYEGIKFYVFVAARNKNKAKEIYLQNFVLDSETEIVAIEKLEHFIHEGVVRGD